MYYECCVCKGSRKDAILHHFPCTEKRLQKWLECINREDLANLLPEQLSKLFVCQKHFERKFITSKSRLVGKAYPSLFTEDEISSGIPCTENTENSDPHTEHSYSRQRHLDHIYCRLEPQREITATGSGECLITQGFSQNFIRGDDFGIVVGGTSRKRHLDHTYSKREPLKEVNNSDSLTSELQNLIGEPQNPVRKNIAKERNGRQRLIQKVNNLSPTCKMIYKEYKKAKQQGNFYRRAKNAMKFNKNHSFEKLTKNLNPYAKKIFKMQINMCTKNKKGRRFSMEEKLIALSIMKQSPKCYRFLHKIFILPTKSTLNKMVSKLNIQTGICPQVFNLIKKEVASWDEKKKICSIIFDEMSLDTALTYNKNKDHINGFVELAEKTNQFADHALVFLLRGAVYKWQQPIAFYYCQGATSGIILKNIIREIVHAVSECTLKPVALICDQGSSFQSAIKSFKLETERNQILTNQQPDGTITINEVNLCIIYDPPHLLKGLRNNFLNKNIIVEGKISQWRDIVDVYETDCNHTEARLLHKLNDQHVIPEKIKKMKVKNCAKVFSRTVSAALSYTARFSHYADGRPVSDTLKNTAETVLFFDKLFDSVNGAGTFSLKSKGKVLRTAVTETSPHHKFWEEAIQKLEKLKYIDSSGKEKSVPSLQNFITTLKSYMKLWQILKNQGIKIMRPRYFNSDPIENFFGQVRAYNYRSNDPNCHSFNCTYKSLLITRIIKFHNETFNCEDDQADEVINLHNLFTENENNEPGHPEISQNIDIILEQARRERINVHSRAYTAGWVVRKLINKMNNHCNYCLHSLTSEAINIHHWISHKEYTAAKRSLSYPSEGAVRCFGTVITETNEYLEHNAHLNNISFNIKTNIMSKYSFDFINCAEHKDIVLNYFIDLTVRFTIMNWCNVINKILKGTDVFRLRNRILPSMQKKAFDKFSKKLKNKSINK